MVRSKIVVLLTFLPDIIILYISVNIYVSSSYRNQPPRQLSPGSGVGSTIFSLTNSYEEELDMEVSYWFKMGVVMIIWRRVVAQWLRRSAFNINF